MDKSPGFVWGYLRSILLISGFIPYYPNHTKKSLFITIINISLHIMAIFRHVDFIFNKLIKRNKEFFEIFFNIFNVLGSTLSAILNLIFIVKRRSRIFQLNIEISKLINELSQYQTKNFTKLTKFIRGLSYYSAVVSAINSIRVIVTILTPKVTFIYKFNTCFNTHSVLMADLNFVIYILNIKIIFELINEILESFKIENRKKGKVEMMAKLRIFYFKGCDVANIAADSFSDGVMITIIVEFIGFVYGFYDLTKKEEKSLGLYLSVMHWYWFFITKLFLKLCVCVLTTKQV